MASRALEMKPKHIKARAWYQKTIEERRAYSRSYYRRMTNGQRERKRETMREFYAKNPDVRREYRSKQKREKPLLFLLRRLKHSAMKRGIDFSLKPEDFNGLPEVCPVLGIPITHGAPLHSPGLPTFDRIDPRKGYVAGNVVIISWRANNLKRDCVSAAELRMVADYIEKCNIVA